MARRVGLWNHNMTVAGSSSGRGVAAVRWTSCSHQCASVTKNYNLALGKVRWYFVAGTPQTWRKVMAACGRIYDFGQLRAFYPGPGSAPEDRKPRRSYRVWKYLSFTCSSLHENVSKTSGCRRFAFTSVRPSGVKSKTVFWLRTVLTVSSVYWSWSRCFCLDIYCHNYSCPLTNVNHSYAA